MKSIRLLPLYTLLIFTLFLLLPSQTNAACVPTNTACSGSTPNLCTTLGTAFCCTFPNECNESQGSLDSIETAIGLGSSEALIQDYSNIGSVLSGLLPYILTGAGIILLVMLVAGGFTMLSGASSSESQEKGKKQITFAIVGFIVIFAAFWIAQVLQIILKVDIIGIN